MNGRGVIMMDSFFLNHTLYFVGYLYSCFLTLEGMILRHCFGAPEIFRVPQNTTCHVRLNMNFSSEKSKYGG